MNYQTVPTAESTEAIGDEETRDLDMPTTLANFVAGNGWVRERNTTRICSSQGENKKDDKLVCMVDPESIRFVTYILFWIMVISAYMLTQLYTKHQVLAGPGDVTNSCPPYTISDFPGSEPVDRTNGFNIIKQSHLHQILGFNNVCIYWDYTPSREVIAVMYAYVEYALIAYVVTIFILAAIEYKKGDISKRHWQVHKFMFPFNLVLCAAFRMIFVITAYDSPRLHSAGFVLLQVALINVALLNMYHVLATDAHYPFFGDIKNTRRAAIIFVTIEVVLSLLSVYTHAYIVFGWGLHDHGKNGHMYPPWAKESFLGTSMPVGAFIDNTWMVVTAGCPLFISYLRSKVEPRLSVTIDLKKRIVNENE